ncbi:MAG: hypothetical protein DHS20C07_20490 [Methyloligella sp.]|nr:MAG: hypothetical protein DHS20C07_20490 [Methyloligella sp.]
MKRILVLLCMTFALGLTGAMADDKKTEIQFPKDYKSHTLYFTGDRQSPNDGQTIRIYANDIAVKGMKKDGKFPYGSVITAEVYKAKKDKDGDVIESTLGRRLEGKFALVAVMEKIKGAGKKWKGDLNNGDWDFATFKPDGSPAKKDLAKCAECHAPLKDEQHIFSIEHF